MSAARTLLQAVRAPSLTAGAMPAVLAAATAAWEGRPVEGLHFALVLLGLVSAQAGVNLVNDYFDDRSGVDADPEFADAAFPLGSRVIQQGLLSRRGVLRLAGACFALAAACGIALDRVHEGHVVLWLALAGGALGWGYTAPPLRIAYHGAGEPVTFALFGPVAGLGAYYVLTGGVSAAAVLVSVTIGLLAMAILFLHHFPQHEADARHGKRTPVVRLGRPRAGRLVAPMLVAPFAVVAGGVGAGLLPWPALAFALAAPLAWRAARTARRRPAHDRAMTGAAFDVLGVHFAGGLLLSAGLWLAP